MIIIAWLIFAFLVAFAAKERGRSFGGFFMLSCVLSPLLSGIYLALIPVKTKPALVGDEKPLVDWE